MAEDGKTLKATGLPGLREIGQGVWTSNLQMPALASLKGGDGPGAPGEVEAYIENDAGEPEPDPVLLDVCRWILTHDVQIERAVIAAALGDIDNLRGANDWLDDDALERWLPAGWSEAQARSALSLTNVFPHNVKSGGPYFGVSFSAAWDDEHGYGLMMMGTELVEAGGADTAQLSWIAGRHARARSS